MERGVWGGGDDWLAQDKLYHLLFCFSISLFVATLCSRAPHPFLRRRSITIASLASLAAGAAKEAGDQIGLWSSSGASLKDGAADVLGVALASLSLISFRRLSRSKLPDSPVPRVSMV